MAQLNSTQVYALARNAGFPPETARKMVAIAQRESSFRTDVVGTINAAKERSYGLWQINLKDQGIKALMQRNGITAENILQPEVNARAAFLLWAGNDRNLDTAWYTERVGLSYQQGEKYRENLARLPAVSTFESAYLGSPVSIPSPSEEPWGAPSPEFGNPTFSTDVYAIADRPSDRQGDSLASIFGGLGDVAPGVWIVAGLLVFGFIALED